MQSAVFELDPSRSFVGSSYIYATPRDFARFGALHLQGGIVNGTQILPGNWVDYTTTPAAGITKHYGAHWSLNRDGIGLPDLPKDIFYLGGNDGQYIFAIPSKNAVIVRLGVMRFPATFEQDAFPRIAAIHNAL
ncbi:MAG: serine hydrolase [Pseudomonadota bacterium]